MSLTETPQLVKVPNWQRRYSRKLLWSDAAVIVVVAGAVVWYRFSSLTVISLDIEHERWFLLGHLMLALCLAFGWLLALTVFDSRDPRVFATGPDEYKRAINASLTTFGIYSIIMFASDIATGREHLFATFPIGLGLLILWRWIWRKRLQFQRKRGKNLYRTVVLGEEAKCVHTIKQLRYNRIAGYEVLGAITEEGETREILPGVRSLGNFDDLMTILERHQADILIVTSADTLTPERLRRIAWQLETTTVDLIVTAALTDIAGPRIHTRPVAGLPLIHVEYPEFNGKRYLVKRVFDLIGSTLALIGLSPLYLLIYLMVKLDSKGPAIFKQQRNGLNGEPFTMYKFRTMIDGADDQLPGVLDRSDGQGPLFKMKQDPRVTRVGRFLRKHSLDELPQFWNVIKGDMSVVGPRPPLPREVDLYDKWLHRRLLVRPGMSGLWQVNGRSDLNWEDSVRLDLYYVENWSLIGDLLIIWRTLRVMFKGVGAY